MPEQDDAPEKETLETLENVLKDDEAGADEGKTSKGAKADKKPDDEGDEADTSDKDEDSDKTGDDGDKAKGEKDPAPPAEKDKGKMVPEAALLAERRKRQDAEAEAERLRTGKSEDEKSDDGKSGAGNSDDDPVEKRFTDERIAQSREFYLELKGEKDFIEKEGVFCDLAKANPALVRQMRASPNPAKFAYQTALNHLDAQALADPEKGKALREKIREEERQKLIEEGKLTETPDEKRKKAAAKVPDVVGATATGKTSEPVRKLQLDDLLKTGTR